MERATMLNSIEYIQSVVDSLEKELKKIQGELEEMNKELSPKPDK